MTSIYHRPAHTGEQSGPQRTDDPGQVQRMVEAVARHAIEIVRDMRPENALSRIVTPEVTSMLARRAALTRRLRATTGYAPVQRVQVTGVRTCIVNERTVEASCVVREPERSRFLAMRWELRHSGWRVTVLEIG
ncbi:Rv3235 family protein [Brachybacterium sp. J144]|uniref:Rv3235 family protein n=1 Tax=Brachybacterium sp. J144 TaxID=3116487 RepID=UPI002E79561F|nr:Rv3235 family protein [Brachybacterium sp. J144]MEE1649613.1 Rv3235 family protein [Brachybacterium sp. J144]